MGTPPYFAKRRDWTTEKGALGYGVASLFLATRQHGRQTEVG